MVLLVWHFPTSERAMGTRGTLLFSLLEEEKKHRLEDQGDKCCFSLRPAGVGGGAGGASRTVWRGQLLLGSSRWWSSRNMMVSAPGLSGSFPVFQEKLEIQICIWNFLRNSFQIKKTKTLCHQFAACVWCEDTSKNVLRPLNLKHPVFQI